MNIIVFGASGKTGKLVVEQALTLQHKVTAFVRNPTKLQINHTNLPVLPEAPNTIMFIDRKSVV